jgi:hypothetical protein
VRGLLFAALLVIVTGCGSSAVPTAGATPQVVGGSSCPAAEAQDLTLSGHFAGHLTCSTSAATCGTGPTTPTYTQTGVYVPINARVGNTDALILFAFSSTRPGTYPAGRLGDDPATRTDQGATFDAGAHWETPTPGGSMTLATNDATGASGTVDVKLALLAQTFAVKGTWRCVWPAG